MMTQKEVYEHDFIGIGDSLDGDNKEKCFEKSHLDLLKLFHEKQKKRIKQEKKGETFFDLSYQNKRDGIKFKQYVGVLMVKDVCFYVWPKADKNSDNTRWRHRLLFMLEKVHKLKVDTMAVENLKHRPNTLFNIFIKKFIDEVAALLNRGLIKTYHKTEGNRTAMKGKLLFNKQITCNLVHQERFYVRYTNYDFNHVMNRILRQALLTIPSITTSSDLRGRAVSMLFNFPELPEIEATPDLFQRLIYDRKSEDYRGAIQLAEMILLNFMPDLHHGGSGVWALMFDMNKLWEEFISRTLQQKLNGYHVKPQDSYPFWKGVGFRKTKIIKPDIVLKEEKTLETFVLDTKWKIPFENNILQQPSDADLHQMYVYLNKFGATKGALVYPGEDEKIVGDFFRCDMLFLPGPPHRDETESNKEPENDIVWQNSIVDRVKNWLNEN